MVVGCCVCVDKIVKDCAQKLNHILEASKGENVTGKVDTLRGDSRFVFCSVTHPLTFNKVEYSVLSDEALRN
jgi:hypothetical protein